MSAREIIQQACAYCNQWRDSTYASKIIGDLEADGYRILAKDELDEVTLEAAAKVAGTHFDLRHADTARYAGASIATAIRNLRSAG